MDWGCRRQDRQRYIQVQWLAAEVLEGELEVTIDGKPQIAKRGLVAIVPSNSLHSVRALTEGRLIVVDHPSRPAFGQHGVNSGPLHSPTSFRPRGRHRLG